MRRLTPHLCNLLSDNQFFDTLKPAPFTGAGFVLRLWKIFTCLPVTAGGHKYRYSRSARKASAAASTGMELAAPLTDTASAAAADASRRAAAGPQRSSEAKK